ncbi:MAG: bacillithiol biosynthesis cysteine-adding enzyme BshC [Acidobacteriia bacterium]|nr:bacillithiol biosynthesis cysteine-adding enzyme BshC [Terriglobia bacterium]
MQCSCIRQTDFAHVTAILADSLYHPERTSRFYWNRAHDFEAALDAAKEIDFPASKRAALITALEVENSGNPLLAKLAQPGTVAVLTGQQVGLFCGPAYTIYKALSAVKLAEMLTAQGVSAVPVFWLATEDHDFAEVNHTWVFDGDHHRLKLEMRRPSTGQPVGDVILDAPPVGELRSYLQVLPYGEHVADWVEQSYQPGRTLGQSFGKLLSLLLSGFPILQVNPLLPAFRELAAPYLRGAVEAGPQLAARVLDRNRELAAAGYHAQVHVEDQTSFVFLLENGKRHALRRHEDIYTLNGRRFTAQELMDRASSLSPNALLRPVVQDSMLPTAAFIAGPSELAYLAQSEVVYRTLLGRMPAILPRSGFTLLDARSQKLWLRYGLTLPDFIHGEEIVRERIAQRLVPPALNGALQQTTQTVETGLESFEQHVAAFDPTLAAALTRSGRKIRYQLEKMGRKIGNEALRRDARASQDAASLYNLVFPDRHPQERLYSILPFVAKFGTDLVEQLYQAVDPNCPDHRLVVI